MKKLLSGFLAAIVFTGYISGGLALNTDCIKAEGTDKVTVTLTQSQNADNSAKNTAVTTATTKASTVTTAATTKVSTVTTAATTKAPAVTTAATTKVSAVTTAATTKAPAVTTKAPAVTTAVTTKASVVTTAATTASTKAVSETTGVFNFVKEDFFIKSHPQNVSKNVDSQVSFSVTVNGENLLYQWQYSKNNGETWIDIPKSDIPSAATSTLNIQATPERDGYRYRCTMDGIYGHLITRSAKLTIVYPDLIIKNPEDQTVDVEKPATFSVGTDADDPKFQWQQSKDGGSTWEDISPIYNKTAGTADLVVTALPDNDHNKYRCIVSSGSNSQPSEAAELTVNYPKLISKQPSDTTVGFPTTSFDVETTRDDVSYQWQKSPDGENWENIDVEKVPSAGTAVLDIPSGELDPDDQVRVIVKTPYQSEISEPAIAAEVVSVDFVPEKFKLSDESAKALQKFYYSYDHEFDLSKLEGTAYLQVTFKNGTVDEFEIPITEANVTPVDKDTKEQITPKSVYYVLKNRELPYKTALYFNDAKFEGETINQRIVGFVDSYIDERGDFSLDHITDPEDATYILRFFNLDSLVGMKMASESDLEKFKDVFIDQYPEADSLTLYQFMKFLADINRSGDDDILVLPFDPEDSTYILRYFNLVSMDFINGIYYTPETEPGLIEEKWDMLIKK